MCVEVIVCYIIVVFFETRCISCSSAADLIAVGCFKEGPNYDAKYIVNRWKSMTMTHEECLQKCKNGVNLRKSCGEISSLFHRRIRASYVYNVCLAWYNVVLTHGSTQA